MNDSQANDLRGMLEAIIKQDIDPVTLLGDVDELLKFLKTRKQSLKKKIKTQSPHR